MHPRASGGREWQGTRSICTFLTGKSKSFHLQSYLRSLNIPLFLCAEVCRKKENKASLAAQCSTRSGTALRNQQRRPPRTLAGLRAHAVVGDCAHSQTVQACRPPRPGSVTLNEVLLAVPRRVGFCVSVTETHVSVSPKEYRGSWWDLTPASWRIYTHA